MRKDIKQNMIRFFCGMDRRTEVRSQRSEVRNREPGGMVSGREVKKKAGSLATL
jgi:hypothetical protein